MKLNDIRDNPGAHKKRLIVGRGIGSTKGKTSGRGVKGQKARTGVRLKGFEGGQMPLSRRLPKRGFKNIFAKDYATISLGRLQAAVDAGRLDAKKAITSEILMETGVASKARDGVRVLGNGTLKAKLDLTVAGASASAVAAIEKAGGKIVMTAKKADAEQPAE
ncbi:MAG: 50S ribosomal protein L15 [Alphaproteobacteria bacterium]|nr:50S ribosomal protein L15 [Alphaproteobacteria bacterium]